MQSKFQIKSEQDCKPVPLNTSRPRFKTCLLDIEKCHILNCWEVFPSQSLLIEMGWYIKLILRRAIYSWIIDIWMMMMTPWPSISWSKMLEKRRDITNENTPLTVQTNNFNFCGYIAVLYFYVNFYLDSD